MYTHVSFFTPYYILPVPFPLIYTSSIIHRIILPTLYLCTSNTIDNCTLLSLVYSYIYLYIPSFLSLSPTHLMSILVVFGRMPIIKTAAEMIKGDENCRGTAKHHANNHQHACQEQRFGFVQRRQAIPVGDSIARTRNRICAEAVRVLDPTAPTNDRTATATGIPAALAALTDVSNATAPHALTGVVIKPCLERGLRAPPFVVHATHSQHSASYDESKSAQPSDTCDHHVLVVVAPLTFRPNLGPMCVSRAAGIHFLKHSIESPRSVEHGWV